MISSITVVLFALMAAFAEASLVGIRLVFTEELEGAGCTKEEHDIVVSIMHDGIIDLMGQQQQERKLFFDDDGGFTFDDGVSDVGNTDPGWCREACRIYAEGQCYVGYPQCEETRRRLSPRPVSDPAEFARLCMEEEEAVLSTIRDGVEEVSESCNAMLQTSVEVSCADLSDKSPVFIQAASSSRPTLMFLSLAAMTIAAAAALL